MIKLGGAFDTVDSAGIADSEGTVDIAATAKSGESEFGESSAGVADLCRPSNSVSMTSISPNASPDSDGEIVTDSESEEFGSVAQ